MKLKTFFTITVIPFWLTSLAQGTWTQKTNFGGTARESAVGFSIGTKGYIGTGIATGNFYNDFWEWDQATNVWTQKANFGGTIRNGAVGFSIGTKGYIGTGSYYNGSSWTYYDDFWEWDQATNIWSQKSSFGGGVRSGAVGFSISTMGYVGIGAEAFLHQDFWEYNPTTDSWTQKTNFGGGYRYYAVGFSIGNKGYIGTGKDGSAALKKDFWEYNPALDNWIQKANYGGTFSQWAVGFSIGNKGYIGTGYVPNAPTQDFYEWDAISDTWNQKANYAGVAVQGAVGFSIGNTGYIGTGHDGSAFKKEFWEFNPLTPVPICLVTVDSLSENNIIVWSKPIGVPIDSIIVYRDTANNNFARIGAVPNDSTTLSQFIDTVRSLYPANGDPKASSWKYKLAMIDTFGNLSAMSPYHQTIFIQNNAANFNWSEYKIEGQPTPVPGLNNYIFQRDNYSTGNFIDIISLSASSTLFTDTAFSNYPNASYRVMTQWTTQCSATKSSVDYTSSRSNVKLIAPPSQLSVNTSVTDAADSTTCNGTATATPSGGNPPFTYLWSTSPFQTDSTATGLCAGIYSVLITDASGATVTATATVSIQTGISNNVIQTPIFTIYPNPNDGTFTFELLSSGFHLPASIIIYNVLEEIIYQSEINQPQKIINLKQSNGIYNLKVENATGVFNKKIILE